MLALAAAALAWGLTHRSSHPDFFGRYSSGYVTLLLGLAAFAAAAGVAAMRPGGRVAGALLNGYLSVAAIVVPLALAEATLRIANPWGIEFFHHLPYHMQGMVDHAELGYEHPRSVSYRLGRNHVALNSLGLRGEELTAGKAAGEARILALGDSVTFGWGVDQRETFAARLEEKLQGGGPVRWKVINAGVNGYNTFQEVTYFRLRGRELQPDIVVLTYVVNDTEDILDPNVTTWRRHPTWPESLPELGNRARQMLLTLQLGQLLARAQRTSPAGAAGSVTQLPGWPRSIAALHELRELCEKANARLLVAVNSGEDAPFRAALEEAGIPVVYLEPAWRAVPAERRHVSRVDPHPSPAVHDGMAELLLAELARRGWLQGYVPAK